jgi:hypothetical protein
VSTEEPTGTSEQPAPKWGDPISEERQAELLGRLTDMDHIARPEPFALMKLTGADVCWLAARSGPNPLGWVPHLHLERAFLRRAHLEGANLSYAHLEGARLSAAHLERADLHGAYLEGAALSAAHLEGADLHGATLDGKTTLAYATLAESPTRWQRLLNWWPFMRRTTSAALGDIRWGGVGTVDLTAVRWDDVLRLGDETALKPNASAGKYEAAVRAYRQVAAQLRAQGMSETADRFSYRAQFVQRRVFRKRRQWGRWFGLWLLDLVSGHGYAPLRSLATYAVINGLFAATYALLAFFSFTRERFESWDSPLVLSVTSFHGRVFFAGGLLLTDWAARVGAIEAMVGLLIEIIFIATFTQRFFGAK